MSVTKLYEGMFLFDSNLAAKDWPGLESHMQELLSKNGGELVYSERWPDRKLSYEIKGCKRGSYCLTYFNATAGAIQGLKRDSELSERVLRLLVLQDENIVEDCDKRVRNEIRGAPEDIERLREAALQRESNRARKGDSDSDDGDPDDSDDSSQDD